MTAAAERNRDKTNNAKKQRRPTEAKLAKNTTADQQPPQKQQQKQHLQSTAADHEAVERVGVDMWAVTPLVSRVKVVRTTNDWLSPIASRELQPR